MFKVVSAEKLNSVIFLEDNVIDLLAWKLINYDKVLTTLENKEKRDKGLPFGKVLEFKNESK